MKFKILISNINFKKVLSIPIILNQILQFAEEDDIKSLKMCFKRIYKLFYEQVAKLKLNEDIEEINISNIRFNKYENIKKLDLEKCDNITNFLFISKLKQLEELNLSKTRISDTSFLEKDKSKLVYEYL